jgi:hypothetical protein
MANDARSNAAGAVAQNVEASDWLNNITQKSHGLLPVVFLEDHCIQQTVITGAS